MKAGDRIPVGRDFPHQSRPALRPTQPPVQLGTGSFPGVRCCRGVTLTPHPLQCRGLKQSRAISLFSLRAFVACERVKPTYQKESSNCSGTHSTPHTNLNIMQWYVVDQRWKPVNESSRIQLVKPGVYFCMMRCVKAPVQSCFTICVVEFVNYSFLVWVQLPHVFCMFSYCTRMKHVARNFQCICKLLSEFTRHVCSNHSQSIRRIVRSEQ